MKELIILAPSVTVLTEVAKKISWRPGDYPKAVATALAAAGVLVVSYSQGTLTQDNAHALIAQIAAVSAAAVGLYEFAKTAIMSALALRK